jgi:hypothetical protein
VLLFVGKAEDLLNSSRVHAKQGVIKAFPYVAIFNRKLISALDKKCHQFGFALCVAASLGVFIDRFLCPRYLALDSKEISGGQAKNASGK